MDLLNYFVDRSNYFLWSYILIVLLIGAGLYFTVKTGFVQFRYFKEMCRLLKEGSGKDKNEGAVSSFQAFCISTASRVGTGNIAGVAMAITMGGAGAVFWMWLIALIGGASSFIESTLAQVYKVKDADGTYKGGPAYYMEKGIGKRWMGILFAILITMSFGLIITAVQSNTISESFSSVFGVNKLLIGIVLSILSAVVVFGGIKRIAKLLEVIVPVFAIAYIGVSLFVVFKNIHLLPNIFRMIMDSAFGLKEASVGILMGTIMQGVKRGLFSNEAGMGSAPNASATAEVSHPVKQGLVQALGVFVDTLAICTCTAFLVLVSGEYLNTTAQGIQITQNALISQIGSFGGIFIAVCIFLFAFSSIISNYYYGESNIKFITGNENAIRVFKGLFIGMIIFGSLTQVAIVWNLSDLFMGLMAVLNIIAIVMLRKVAIDVFKDYDEQKKAGIKEPVFNPAKFNIEGVTAWESKPISKLHKREKKSNIKSLELAKKQKDII